jgi:ribosomal protein S7
VLVDGKKSTAERIVYGALAGAHAQSPAATRLLP